MNGWNWQAIGALASWFSALGTFAAVVVALYLANKDRRVHLKVNAGIGSGIIQSSQADPVKGMVVFVTNVGYRSAHVTYLFLKPVPWGKTSIMFIPPKNQYSSNLPVTLNDGGSARYFFPKKEFLSLNLEKGFYKGKCPKLVVRLAKIVVSTSVGKSCSTRIEPALQDWFLSTGLFRKKGDNHVKPTD